MIAELPYGRGVYRLDVGDRPARVLTLPSLGPPVGEVADWIDDALARPLGTPPLAGTIRRGDRVTVIVSDATRDEPRRAFLDGILRHVPEGVRWTLAVATGTHGPSDLARLDVPSTWLRDAESVNHDGHANDGLVELGVTPRGTPIRVHRCVVETDLVIGTGCVRPHYFAGFGAGAKAVFPGLGCARAIRINHRWKQSRKARSGIVDGNPCREDIEDVVAAIPTPMFLLNGVAGPDHGIRAIVAGHVREAFRAAVSMARPWFSVRAESAELVIAAERGPVTSSVYQAAKIAAAAAPLVAPGGTLVVVAECPDGVGPVEVVNEGVLRIGVLPRLPERARLMLYSGLPEESVQQTLLERCDGLEALLAERDWRSILITPYASQIICEGAA